MKILIAVDDDAASREALAFAHRLVSKIDEVVVLNVTSYTILIPFGGDPFSAGMAPIAVDDKAIAQIDELSEELVEQSTVDFAAKVEGVTTHGSVGDRICATAVEHGIELIVIGCHQRGAFGRFIHGSVSDYVVHHAPCSVLVAR